MIQRILFSDFESNVNEVKPLSGNANKRFVPQTEQSIILKENLAKPIFERTMWTANLVQRESEQDLSYIWWPIFDEIPKQVYTIKCEGYFNKNGQQLDNEASIKHPTNGAPNDDIVICDENSEVIDYMDYDDIYYRTDNKYDLL